MKILLNQLIQLQELTFAKEEQRASGTTLPLSLLEKAITELRAQLPAEVADRYDRLQKRYPLAVVPLAHGSCSRCNLAVPPNIVNIVKAGEILQNCPHCGRYLYSPDTVARQPKKKIDSDKAIPLGIARFSSPSLMIPRLAGTTPGEVVGELTAQLAASGFIENASIMSDLALRREAIISTAVEHGLAFPHVRDVEGGGLTLALGLKPKGLNFGAAGDHLSKIFFFIVIPTPATAFYLRLLAGLVRTFEATESRNALLECEKPDQMWKMLIKLTRETIP